MNSIWDKLYDSFKDRRYGFLFFLSLAMMAVVCGLIAGIRETAMRDDLGMVLPVMGACGAIAIGLAICRAVRRRRERVRFPPLSCDEVRVARSKLTKEREPRKP